MTTLVLLPAWMARAGCSIRYADTVVHQNLHAMGAAVGEEVGEVRRGGAEHVDHTGECSLGARPHVQRLGHQPHRFA